MSDFRNIEKQIPLAVDLDGTLIKTDLLIESILKLLKKKPWFLFFLPFWFISGKSKLKHEIALRVDLNISILPYHDNFIEWLKIQKENGTFLVLATASHKKYANQIATYLGIFDQVVATDSKINLKGKKKQEKLINLFGNGGFDYAGNNQSDVNIWRSAKHAILVNATENVTQKASRVSKISKVFKNDSKRALFWIKEIRMHQWLKNLLIFIPAIGMHEILNKNVMVNSIIAFFAFSLCSSIVYLINDLFDLDLDRTHPNKRHRPIASGNISLLGGLKGIAVLIIGIGMLTLLLPEQFILVLCLYFMTTLTYSLYFKYKVIADVVILSILYIFRIFAGSAATEIEPSFWIIAFSLFFFLNLALVKRYNELIKYKRSKILIGVKDRDYSTDDLSLLSSLGGASGYISILVLALYINSAKVITLYSYPKILWLVCPLLLYWISWIWIVTHRGNMDDDPVVYAVKDRISQIIVLLILLFAWMAA